MMHVKLVSYPLNVVSSSIVFSVLFGLAAPCLADEKSEGGGLRLSGFVSVVAGRTFGDSADPAYIGPNAIDGNPCPPCYVADWGNGGVYKKQLSLRPESRAGIQASYHFNADASVVGQLVIRGSDPKPNVQWAYGSYKLTPNFEVQVGRKRIPLYYYSDFQDIGVSYPWVTPPPELYGWEATNYNGASLRYAGNAGDANLSSSLFFGSETVNDSLYQRLYYSGKTKVRWKNIIGTDFEINRGPFTARAIYMQTRVRTINLDIGLDNTADLKAYGVAMNLEFDKWFVLSELTQLTRQFIEDRYKVTAPAFTLGAGMRLGKWTPFVNYAKYREISSDQDKYAPQTFRRSGVSLRYDLDSNSAVKAQLDHNTDITKNFGGTATVFRLSYDRTF